MRNFSEEDGSIISIVIKLQARVRGILIRDKIKVKASKMKKKKKAAQVHEEENELIVIDI